MKKTIMLLWASFALASCQTRGESLNRPNADKVFSWDDINLPVLEPKIFSQNVVFNYELDSLFNQHVFCGDATYWTPSLSWVTEVVIPSYKNFLDHQDITYNQHFDCDDYTRTFAAFAHLKFQNYKKDDSSQGIAVGEVWYFPDPANFPGNKFRHAINVIILDDKNVCFIEPQGCRRVVLTEYEFKHITLIKF